MMKNEMKTNNKTVLLTIVAVFAMIAAGTVAIAATSEVEAAPAESAVCTVLAQDSEVEADASYYIGEGTVKVTATTAVAGVLIYVANGAGVTVTANVTASVYCATAFSGDNKATYDAAAFAITGLNAAADMTVTVTFTANNAAKVSGNAAAMTIGVADTVTADPSVTVTGAAVANMVYAGASFYDKSSNKVTYSKAPAATYKLDEADDVLVVKKGNTTVMAGANTVSLTTYKDNVFESAAGVTFTYVAEGTTIGASGIIAKGEFDVVAGKIKIDAADLKTTIVKGKTVSVVTGVAEATTAAAVDSITYTDDVAKTIAYAPAGDNKVIIGEYVHPDKNPKVAMGLELNELAVLYVLGNFTYGNKDLDDVAKETITLNNKSILDVWGVLKGVKGNAAAVVPTIVNAGTGEVKIRAGAEVTGFVNAAGASTLVDEKMKEVPAIDDEDLQGISGSLDANMTIANAEVPAAKKLTIPAGITLTVTGMLVINAADGIIVNGTLVIADGAMLAANDNTVGVVLGDSGKIVNNGTIAKYKPITISASTGAVTLKGIDSFSIGVASKKLVVSGDIELMSGANTSDLEFNAVTFNADVTIGEGVVAELVTVDSKLAGVTMTVEGVLDPASANLVLAAGSVVDMDGFMAASATKGIVAETTVITGQEKSTAPAQTMAFTATQGTAAKDGGLDTKHDLTGYTISVYRFDFIDDDGVEMYVQVPYIEGTLSLTPSMGAGYALKAINPAVLTATGSSAATHLFLAEGDELVENIMSAKLAMDTSKLIVEGKYTTKNAIANTVGAIYSITASDVTTNYAVDYNTGLDGIAGYKDKTVELVGVADYAFDLDESLMILQGESVTVSGGVNEFMTIPEGAVLYVCNGGAFDEHIIEKIDGKVIVEADGDCTPKAELYQVFSEDEDGTITYCGFVTALAEAEPGDVITVTGAYPADALTVPAGITVVVGSAGTLTIKKTLNITAGATLNVEGTLNVGTADGKTKNVRVNNSGDFNISSCVAANFYTFTTNPDDTPASDADKKTYALQITSAGEFVYRTTQLFPAQAVLVGVTFVDGTTTVLTSIDNALEAGAAEIVIDGEYASTEAIDLDGSKLTVGGKASFASIDVTGGELAVTGELTATIIGVAGEDDEAVSVVLSGFKGTITDKKVGDDYVMAIEAMTAGSVAIMSGEATIAVEAITVAEHETLYVAEDAELIINDTVALTLNGFMDVDGVLTVNEGKTLDITGDELLIDGAAIVFGTLIIDDSAVTGVISVFGAFTSGGEMLLLGSIAVDDSTDSTATATFADTVLGVPGVGAAPEILGKKITLSPGCALVVFPGATVAPATVSDLKSTEFYANGVLYVTAYANAGEVNAVAADGIINEEIPMQGYDMTGSNVAENWTDITGAKATAATKVGAKTALFFEGVQLTAKVVVSTTTGTSVFVDGVKYASGTTINDVAVGTHTVKVIIDPGYKGTTEVTFNGKVLSGLMVFEITPEMVGPTAKYVLSVTGDIVIDEPVVPEQEKEDNTIIMVLLAVLVVMVVILAIVVILRMMRS